LRYTESILCDGKYSVLGAFRSMILRAKSASSLTITWYLTREGTKCKLIFFLSRSKSEYSRELGGGIHQCNSRITLLDRRRGTLSSLLPTSGLLNSKYRRTNVIWVSWMHGSRAQSRTWPMSGLLLIVSVPLVVWVGRLSSSERISVGWIACTGVIWLEAAEFYAKSVISCINVVDPFSISVNDADKFGGIPRLKRNLIEKLKT